VNKILAMFKSLSRLTIRRKMLAFCIILLSLPSIIVGIFSYVVAKNSTDELIKKNLENSVKLMSQTIVSAAEMVENGQLSLENAQENMKILMLGVKREDGTRPINPFIDLGENGYFYVIDKQGTLLAHPNLEGENLWDRRTSDGFYYIQDVIHQGQQGGGFTYYYWALPDSDKEALKITYALEIPEWDWILVAGSYYQDYAAGQIQILISTLAAVAACIAVGIIGVFVFSNHIANPIVKVTKDTELVAEGDLTTGDVKVRNRDEIGKLASHFNRMKSHLKSLVEQVASSSNEVQGAVSALRASIGETTLAARNIAETTQQIATDIEVQSSNTKQGVKAVEEMAMGIQRIADTSSTAYEVSVRSEEEAKRGYDLIAQTIEKMHAVEQAMGKIVEVMQVLNRRSQEISKIVTVMKDIAAQTSLLSLNASIEAARAGEEGRGFAVVASEVKKLAELSKSSSDQISSLIQTVQADIAAASDTTAGGISEFRQSLSIIGQMGSAFERIVASAQAVVGHIEETSAASEEMSASSQQILASLQELGAIAENTASRSETISAVTEEQIATMEQLYQAADALNEMAIKLQTMINRFKVS